MVPGAACIFREYGTTAVLMHHRGGETQGIRGIRACLLADKPMILQDVPM